MFDASKGYFLIAKPYESVYLGSATFLSLASSLSMTELTLTTTLGSNLFAKTGLFKTASLLYFAGSTIQINAQTFTSKVAFLMNYPSTNCLASSPITTSMTVDV